MFLLSLLFASAPAHALNPPGEVIEDAAIVDITPGGFEAIKLIADQLIPSSIPLPGIYEYDIERPCVNIPIIGTQCITVYEYELDVSNFEASLEIATLDILPRPDRLDLVIDVTAQINSAANPGRIDAFARAIEIINITQSCEVYTNPITLGVTTSILPQLVQGPDGPRIIVGIAPISLDFDVGTFLRIEGSNCILSALTDVLDFIGVDVIGFLVDLARPLVEDAINDFIPEIEALLEDALGAIRFEVTLDLGGASLSILVEPSQLLIDDRGLRIGLSGAVDPGPTPADCVLPYAPEAGSEATGTRSPELGDGPQFVDHHLGVFVDDDFVNQILYGVWYGGLLCVELGGEGGGGGLDFDLPIPLDTAIFNLLAPGGFEGLFTPNRPIRIVTRPVNPPRAFVDGAYDVGLEVADLGLDIYAELDGRLTRAVGVSLDVDVGVDLRFSGSTGELSADLAFSPDAFSFSVPYNELDPAASDTVANGLANLVGTIVGPLIGGLGDSLGFALPSFEGLGLTTLLVREAGPDRDRIGLFANIGLVDYESTGDGCDGGCDAGCSSGGLGGGAALPGLIAGLALLRRRRIDVEA